MNSGSCIHYAIEKYCGTDKILSYQGLSVFGIELNVNGVDMQEVYRNSPDDIEMGTLSCPGYLYGKKV